MAKIYPFKPKWKSHHPGVHLQDVLDERGYSLEDLANRSHIPLDIWRGFLREERGCSEDMARVIAGVITPDWENGDTTSLESRAAFWMRLQAQWDAERVNFMR